MHKLFSIAEVQKKVNNCNSANKSFFFQGIISPITLLNQVSLSAKTKGAFAPKFYEEHKSCPSTQFGRAIFLKFEASLIDTLYKGAIRVNT